MEIQWYPGHMAKAKRMMQEHLKWIDVLIEMIDARAPMASKNPEIEQLAHQKGHILLFNKADLAEEKKTTDWKIWYEQKGFLVTTMNAKEKVQTKPLMALIQQAHQEKLQKNRRKGILNRPTRIMIVGIPNVGKSTLINTLVGRASAKTGNRPGVTKGKQWISLQKNIELLDTPGILWPKFEDQMIGKKLAWIGSVKEELLYKEELAIELLSFLLQQNKTQLYDAYGWELQEEDPVAILEKIAMQKGCKQKGNEYHLERAAILFLEDFRQGKLGRITLETCEKK